MRFWIVAGLQRWTFRGSFRAACQYARQVAESSDPDEGVQVESRDGAVCWSSLDEQGAASWAS